MSLKTVVSSQHLYGHLCDTTSFVRWFVLSAFYLHVIVILFYLFSGCSSTNSAPHAISADTSISSEMHSAGDFMAHGSKSFQRGNFEQTIAGWKRAAELYDQEDNSVEQCNALVRLSQVYHALGQFEQASKNLEMALNLAESSDDQTHIALITAHLGNIHISLGEEDVAYQKLNEALSMARELESPALSSAILNDLGNLFTSQKKYSEAISSYNESIILCKKAGNNALMSIALTNAATASLRNGAYPEANGLLDRALDQIRSLDDSHEKAFGLINIALAYNELLPYITCPGESLLILASETLNEAAVVAETIGDPRTLSYAYGYQGKLYEDEHRYQDALQLTRRAAFEAQKVNAPESLYRWQYQTGRLLRVMGETDDAISSYRHALITLQSIRHEMTRCYGGPRSSFRKTAGSVCFDLVDLLLLRASKIDEHDKRESYLIEARDAVELLKVYELQDYFQDDCVDAARSPSTRLDRVSETAAVIYAIFLRDRAELLVNLPDGLKRFSVQVGVDTITEEIRNFRKKLEKRTTHEYLPHAQKLYDWLLRPLEGDLESKNIDTLVFVPDGQLRTIPMAALHDGNQFLINKYALAITPGIYLADPRPIKRENIRVLTVGLTEPVQGFPPLPYISSELQTIQDLYEGKLFLNNDFLISNIEDALKEEKFDILHIASHGQFENDIEKTFILAFDDKLTMDRLDKYVGLLQFRDYPLELLTLSACDTAIGDDRAALGLAGVAIKAGARSAIATLWHINDLASSTLIGEFYKQLRNPSVSRALALQRAQLNMLNDRRFKHPGYWSPFLLINNWL